jgi:prevent-host-death family protein
MDVAVSDLRAHLSDWLARVGAGEEVVITDRGTPVARLVGVSTTSTIERLTSAGVISRPAEGARPKAAGRRRVTAAGSVSDLVGEQRR